MSYHPEELYMYMEEKINIYFSRNSRCMLRITKPRQRDCTTVSYYYDASYV